MTAAAADAGLHDRPVLVLDPGMHTAIIRRADVDRAGRVAVTASDDKSVRVWSLADGSLQRTIRLPAGPGHVGKVYAVAISPDGTTVAAGGVTHAIAGREQVYLFHCQTGTMLSRIGGFPDVVYDVSFSPDGNRLAVALGNGGVRLFIRGQANEWTNLAEDVHYGDASLGVAFAPDGRWASTSLDGNLRLYDANGSLLRRVATRQGEPYGLAFNSKDGRLAVGFHTSTAVEIYDSAKLQALPSPDVSQVEGGNLMAVAWSLDGTKLFAAGMHSDRAERKMVIAWDGRGTEPHRTFGASSSTIMSLRSLPNGTLLVAAQDPFLALFGADDTPLWQILPQQIDPRGQRSNFTVSSDGMSVEFGLKRWGRSRLRYSLSAQSILPAVDDGQTLPPIQDELGVAGWQDGRAPTLNGVPLPLDTYETARSLAFHPTDRRFLLGTEWALRAFDVDGSPLWPHPVQAPNAVWAVNVTRDGRLGVALCGDGTIRWHRIDDGAELLALFAMPDGENWVAWTPEGVYAATPAARAVLRWHVNHGWDAAGEAVPASAIPETFRPDVIPHVLPQLGTPGALAVAELARIRSAVQRATGSDVAPGARLHVLAIGVSDHGAAARHLDLAFASQDARDVAAALRGSQGGLYARVMVSELIDAAATKEAIFDELAAIRDQMARGTGDVALVLFSGHGALVDGKFYLLPHGVSAASPAALKATALAAVDFHDEIAAIARHGRVLLLVDACRSGAAVAPLDRSLRALLDAPGTTVFTASTAGEASIERADWRNGAFTEALLEAFRADADRDGLIRISDLSRHLSDRVPALTGGAQRPEVDIRFDTRILAATG